MGRLLLPFIAILMVITIALIVWLSRTPRDSAANPTVTAKFCPETFEGESTTRLQAVLPTDSGMHAIWDPSAYADICGYETWEKQVLETKDNERHVRAGHFVPLYVHADGSPAIEIRVGRADAPSALADAESAWVTASSEEYLFVSKGTANVSGIEYIGGKRDPAIRSLALPTGRWRVKVHLLEAPESVRSQNGLYPPDLLVLANPETAAHGPYRQSEETFDRLP
jgi:hypothetical protein